MAVERGGQPALPIAAFREEIVTHIARHTVTIVKGDTGSGKSSQLPQYVLETSLAAAAAAKGAPLPAPMTGSAGTRLPAVFVPPEMWGARQSGPAIYVTQPRRVAAVTLAKRVAEERGEPLGGVVGYRIGHDANVSDKTRVTFCTTGWLLQWLVASASERSTPSSAGGGAAAASAAAGDASASGGGGLGASHIILDEVHERAVDSDLVLLVIKLALARAMAARVKAIRACAAVAAAGGGSSKALIDAAKTALTAYASRPRIILMSATIDTTLFSNFMASLAADMGSSLAAAGLDADHPVMSVRLLSALPTPAPSATAYPRPPQGLLSGSLGDLLLGDTPQTCAVGAKRYPVREVFLENIYSDAQMQKGGLTRSESSQVTATIDSFNKAAAAWKLKRPAAGGGIADSLTLPDAQATALNRLAARIALAAAAPAGGDTILVFVPGLADISNLTNAFLEVGGARVSAPAGKMAVGTSGAAGGGEDDGSAGAAGAGGGALPPQGGGDDDDDDAEALALQANKGRRGAAHALVDDDDSDGSDDSEDEEEDEKKAATKPAVPTSAATKPPAAAAAARSASSSSFAPGSVRLLPMHSLLSFEDQMAAFDTGGRDADPRTRIVIATNIAESSVTIPDVTTVVDFGRAKQVEFVPALRAPALRTTWISQASAAQRAGRAGRVCPGVVYRLYTRGFLTDVMPAYELPEMLRLGLEGVVLKIKMLNLPPAALAAAEGTKETPTKEAVAPTAPAAAAGAAAPLTGTSAKRVLALSLQSPDASNVDSALARLAALGALTSAADDAAVTTFGRMLSSFPGDLALGKLVAVGVALGCVADAIVLAAACASGDPFLMPYAGVASSLVEHSTLVAKVTRAKWALSRDPLLTVQQPAAGTIAAAGGATGAPVATAGSCSWSEPLTARAAYIAWRATPVKDRGAWCAAAGIVARRMATLHSVVREVGARIARDHPSVAHVVAMLNGHGGGAAAAAARGEGDGRRGGGRGGGRGGRGGGGRGPAPKAITSHPAPPTEDGDGDGSSAGGSWPPPGLFTTNTHLLRLLLLAAHAGTGLIVGAASSPKPAASGTSTGVDPTRSVSLRLGPEIPAHWISSMTARAGGAPIGGGGGGAVKGAAAAPSVPSGDLARALAASGALEPQHLSRISGTARVALLECSPDWDTVPRGIRLPGTVRPLLGLDLRTKPAAAAVPATTTPSTSCYSSPLLHALPVTAQVLLQVAGQRRTIALPTTGGPGGGVVGASFVDGSSAVAPTVPVEVSVGYSVDWKTSDALSGRAAFGGSSSTATASPAGAAASTSAGLSAKPTPQSLLRFAVDATPTPAPTPLPLLAVSSSVQLQERMNKPSAKDNGGGSSGGSSGNVSAVMSGSTLLWRDATTTSLALLLWSRGTEVLLEWQGGNRAGAGQPMVTAVRFDPRGPRPLRLAPTRITLAQLAEVNALRRQLSVTLESPHRVAGAGISAPSGDGSTSMSPLAARILRLLHLDGTTSNGAPSPPAPAYNEPISGSLLCDFRRTAVTGGAPAVAGALAVAGASSSSSASFMSELLPPLVCLDDDGDDAGCDYGAEEDYDEDDEEYDEYDEDDEDYDDEEEDEDAGAAAAGPAGTGEQATPELLAPLVVAMVVVARLLRADREREVAVAAAPVQEEAAMVVGSAVGEAVVAAAVE